MSTNPLKSRQSEAPGNRSQEEWVDHGNMRLAELGRKDVRWSLRDGKAVLDWTIRPHIAAHPFKHPMDRRGEPMSAEDTRILNNCLEDAGATARYRPDGTRYSIADAA
jgi:hypothetical protein